ncbi:MAG: hypothetical protein WAK91_09850 [Candidatus Acidiferrales bacterium]|jgi:hypothetical protein
MLFDEDNAGTLAMERALLAALCQYSQDDPFRKQILELLSFYNWRSGDHRAVYDALARWKAEPAEIRNGIAARLTRIGFPDIDVEPYFAPTGDLTVRAFERLRERINRDPSGSASQASRILRNR